jgi:hypothetical protein
LAVEIKELSEERNGGFRLQIYLTQDLELAQVGYRVWTNVLRMKVEEV